MNGAANRENGHLAVAGIRILTHRDQHPPTVEELAEFLGWSREWCGVLVTELGQLGAVLIVDSAFTRRVEVKDHLALETLPGEKDASTIDDEIHDFVNRKKAEHAKLDSLFAGDAARQQKQKMEEMAQGLFSTPPKETPAPDFGNPRKPEESE